MTPVDLDELARDLGLTVDQVAAYVREAIGAGLLSIVAVDDDTVTLQAAQPKDPA